MLGISLSVQDINTPPDSIVTQTNFTILGFQLERWRSEEYLPTGRPFILWRKWHIACASVVLSAGRESEVRGFLQAAAKVMGQAEGHSEPTTRSYKPTTRNLLIRQSQLAYFQAIRLISPCFAPFVLDVPRLCGGSCHSDSWAASITPPYAILNGFKQLFISPT